MAESKKEADGFLLSSSGEVLDQYSGSEEVVKVPETVTAIGMYAFSCCCMRQVLLPPGLLYIDMCAFACCKKLQSISLPEGLQKIGAEAFAQTGITELVIPKSVREIGTFYLSQCQMQRLTILGKPQGGRETGASLSAAAGELTADALAFKDYPDPYQPVHGLRNFARRWLAGEDVPSEAAVRFRSYLKHHYREHWKEPLLLRLAIEMQVIPAEEIDSAVSEALESGDPTITAALLAYQNDVIPRKVLERIRRENRQKRI